MYNEDKVGEEFFVNSARNNQIGECTKLRENDEKLMRILESLGVDCSKEILGRLLLLDKRRMSQGKIIETSYLADDGEGEKVKKSMETHLEHSLNVAEVCNTFVNIFPQEWQKEYLVKIKSAAIFHDIGKTGPLGATPEEQKTFSLLFSFFEPNKLEGRNFKETTIQKAIERHSLPEEKEMMLKNLSGLGLSPDQPMSEVFGRHVDYTYQILKSIPNIDPEIIFLAASHHCGLHNYPYQLKDEELAALLPNNKKRSENLGLAAAVVELADGFEAMSFRGEAKEKIVVIDKMIEQYTKAAKDDPTGPTKELDILNKLKIKFAEEK